MSRSKTALLFLSLPLCACHIRMDSHVTVDGVRLTEKHEEVLELTAWPAGGIDIEARQGDVRVEHGEGATTVTVLLHERTPGVAHARFEGGKLVAASTDGSPCAVGSVHVRTPGPVDGMRLETGMGDVTVDGVSAGGNLHLSTGMGDVRIGRAGSARTVDVESGMGDLEITGTSCERVVAHTGMGDVRISDVDAGEAELSSGMGDVEVERSKGRRVKAESGLGDVELRESAFETRELDTGLGHVTER